ncbi:hypothetical protein BDD12DRAFT_862656 [Trichophaea hybrida]|nr:hypothetical protein BDD12DRAFT_862656 [Trichophaea hybrida]
MPRPGPKSTKLTLEDRVDILERLVRLSYTPDGPEKKANSARLFTKLDASPKSSVYCPICSKEYSRRENVRRHVMSTSNDPAHAELATQFASLTCRKCGKEFQKRESVTKHEKTCTGE